MPLNQAFKGIHVGYKQHRAQVAYDFKKNFMKNQ